MGASQVVSGEVKAELAGAVVDLALRLVEVDQPFAALVGLPGGGALGQPLADLFPDLEAPAREVLATGRPLRRVPLRLGRTSPVPLYMAPVCTVRGTTIGVELLAELSEPAGGALSAVDDLQGEGGRPGPAGERSHPPEGNVSLALAAAQMGTWASDLRTRITDRGVVEAALRISEGRFRATFEHAPVGIAHVALDGHWLQVNERLCAIIGYPRDELLGRTFKEITHPDDLDADLAQMERTLAGEISTYQMEKRYVRKDGGEIWANLTVSLVRPAGGEPPYFIAVVEDISRRKAAEAALRFQAQLLDAVGQGVIATDLDGAVRYWNRYAERLYGWPAAEAVGCNILDLVATEMSRQQGEAIIAQLQVDQRWAGQYLARRRDGSTFPAQVTDTPLYGPDGSVVGMVGISDDISQHLRLAAEREELLLRERRARAQADEALALLDTLITTAPTGLCFLSPDYCYLRINDTLAAMNGFPAAAHLGRTVREVLPTLAPAIEPLLERVLATGEPLIDQELVEERAPEDGGRRIWRVSYYPVRLPDGTVAGLGVVANDITLGRLAAETLRMSEERFRVVLESAQIVVYTADRDLRYTWIYNPRLHKGPAEVLGLRDEELLPLEEAAVLTAIKQRVLTTERGERAEVTLVVEGERRWYDLNVEPLRDGAGAVVGLMVAAVDITVRRATEVALRASEIQAAVMAEAAPAILYSAAPDGATTYLSQGYYSYTGTAVGSGEGAGWAAIMHPDDQPEVFARWDGAAATGEPFEAVYRMRRADGVYRWFRTRSRPQRDAQGVIVAWFGVALDIDDAMRAEAEREALLAREQAARTRAERTAAQLAQLQDLTAALAQAHTPAQVGEVVVRRAASTLGASSSIIRVISPAGDMLDLLASENLPAEVTSHWHSVRLDAPLPIAQVVRGGAAVFLESPEALRIWHESLGPTGNALSYEAAIMAPLLIEGRAIGSLALTFDAPRLFDAEDRSFVLALAGQCAQALERARLYAAAQEAVAARDSFIAIASHDLRTPITALLGQAQLLERRVAADGLSERGVRSARAITHAATRLHRMIEALLDLSHLQMGQLTIDPAPLQLGPFVRRVVRELQPTLAGHNLLLEGDALTLPVLGDELRLEQVLHNLIGNAVKYSPEGGVVRVTLEAAGSELRLRIADEGIGISAEALPHLFERFYRAPGAEHHARGGLGLGLYVVRSLVELHGGSITVTSVEGAGSTFTVTLPAA